MPLTLTDIGAAVGSLAGLSSLIWNIIQWNKDRPHLKVNAGIANVYTVRDGIDRNSLVVTFVNTSKRPINITRMEGTNTEGRFLINAENLPRMLKESEVHNEKYSYEAYGPGFQGQLLIELYAVDSQDRKWYVPDIDILHICEGLKKIKGNS